MADAFWVPDRIGPGRFRLPASDAACIGIPGRQAPMGGVTAAAAIEAMEAATGKGLSWATTQFLAPAPTETDFEIGVEVVGGSARRPQARATLRDASTTIAVVCGSLGPESEGAGRAFLSAPAVPRPEDCLPLVLPDGIAAGGLLDQFDRRLACEDQPAGRQAVWFRSRGRHPVSAGSLAVIGDFVAGAHPDTRGSVGLDNSLRIATRPSTEWILADTQIAYLGDRLLHGGMTMFSDSGELIALASLTAVRPPERPPA